MNDLSLCGLPLLFSSSFVKLFGKVFANSSISFLGDFLLAMLSGLASCRLFVYNFVVAIFVYPGGVIGRFGLALLLYGVPLNSCTGIGTFSAMSGITIVCLCLGIRWLVNRIIPICLISIVFLVVVEIFINK